MTKLKRIGSRAEVYHGVAIQTTGHLKKKDLFKDKHGSIKSKKASQRAKKNQNLGGLLKEKGCGCFDYKKNVKVQLGGGKKKKDVDLEKHIFIFSNGVDTFTLPQKYKGAKLKYKCDCPFSKIIKHTVSDHIEHPDMAMESDSEMGFALPEKCHLKQNKDCECGMIKKKHKIKEHKKKGGRRGKIGKTGMKMATQKKKFGQKFGKMKQSAQKLGKKGTALGQKMATQAQNLDFDKMTNQAQAGIQQFGNTVQAGIQQASVIGQQLGQSGQQVMGQLGQTGQQIGQQLKQTAAPIMEQNPMAMTPQIKAKFGGKK